MTRFPHGTPVYRTHDIRRVEAAATGEPDPPRLMERAGLAAAELARELAGGTGKRIVVFAGPGNNGGDALVVARHLKQLWFDVTVVFTGNAGKLSADAAAAFEAWRAADGGIATDISGVREAGLVVDGLFGMGLQRELDGRYAVLVDWINAANAPVLALDIPSGIESDSGRVLGCAVRASHTITFIALKPGLLTLDGPDHVGALHVAALGLDAPALVPSTGAVIGEGVLQRAVAPRRLNSHKGTYGNVGIIGGATGMVGAALLAGRAALKLGAGRVYAGFEAEDAPRVDPVQPELMLRSASAVLELDRLLSCLAIGPGLGQSDEARRLLHAALVSELPLIVDADGLSLIAASDNLRERLRGRTAPTILTPHPAEAGRLLGVKTSEVQQDRVASAMNLAQRYRCGVVLKGAGSICAWPDETWAINTTGNPGMASAGMGDVLSGILAALLAQGAAPEIALAAGVYLHGAAADAAIAGGRGPVGLAAGETIAFARELINLSTASVRRPDRP